MDRLDQRRNNYIILGENFYLDNKKEKAIQFFNKALEFEGIISDDVIILFNIAIIYDELEDYIGTFNTYKRILVLDHKNPGAYYGLAIMEEKLKRFDKALEYYFKAIELDPTYDRAYYFAANLCDEMGDKEKAIELYKKVIELDDEDYHAYNNLGSLYEELGDNESAYKMLEKSIELESDFYKSLFNMGVVYKRFGNNKMALDFYYKSLEKNKEYHYSYLNISAIFIEEKEYNESIKILTIGIRNNPEAEDLYYNRACCYSILGKEDSAISDIIKALDLDYSIINWVRKDNDFKNLYNNERFIEIIKESDKE